MDTYNNDLIETVIVPRARDLGGFEVRRALPSAQRQMVGPFVFWDQELQRTLNELEAAESQLLHQERLSTLGRITGDSSH